MTRPAQDLPPPSDRAAIAERSGLHERTVTRALRGQGSTSVRRLVAMTAQALRIDLPAGQP